MADPITALAAIGLAGNVAQFVEQSLEIVSKGREAYNSVNGVTEEHINIEEVTSALQTSSQQLSLSLSNCRVSAGDDDEDTGLISIAQSCSTIADSLIALLETFRVEPGKFRRLRSLGQAIKASWKKDEVENLEVVLKNYQRQLDTRIIVSLRIRFEQLDAQNAQQYRGLYESAKETLDVLKSFQSHQTLVELELQSIKDLVRLRPSSPLPLYDSLLKGSLQTPQTVLPAPQNTILHIAARNNDVKAIRQALDASHIGINGQDRDGRTALHISATAGNLKSTKYLCQRDARLDIEDEHGRTPLHCAAMHNHITAIRTLLSFGAKDSKEDDDGKLAIDLAIDTFVKLWLSLGIDMNIRDPRSSHTALMHFSQLGHSDVVRLLIQEGADMQAKDDQGHDALMLASMQGATLATQVLCFKGAKVDAENKEGDTALILAAAGGHYDTVSILLGSRADVNHRNRPDGYAAFTFAVFNSHWDIARLLLDAGASIEGFDKGGFHLLGLCAKKGKLQAVKWLLEANANVDAQNSGSWTALMEVASVGHDSIVPVLLASGACTELREGSGSTALQYAATHGRSMQIQMLLKAGANPNNINHGGWSPLAEATSRGHFEAAKLLLSKGAYVDTRGNGNYTPLQRCFFDSHYECARLLLAHGAYSSPQNIHGWTPLHEAAARSRTDMAKLLLDNGAKLELKDVDGYTALCKAASLGHLNFVKLLLEHRADTSATNKDGWSALAEACFHGNAEVVKVLLNNGADTEVPRIQPLNTGNRGWTPLMRAALKGYLDVVQIMLNAGANVHAKTERGQTASMIAHAHGQENVYNYLILEETKNPKTHQNVVKGSVDRR